MVNRTLGNHFEQELCELLAQNGFWAHNMAQNQAGQPADVIAVKNGLPVLIDCKVCSGDRFLLSRIEENQETAMSLWGNRGNRWCYFAIKFSSGEIYMVPFTFLQGQRHYRKKSLAEKDLPEFYRWSRWVKGF